MNIDINKNQIKNFTCNGEFSIVVIEGKINITSKSILFNEYDVTPIYKEDKDYVFITWLIDELYKDMSIKFDIYYDVKNDYIIAKYGDDNYLMDENHPVINRAKILLEELEIKKA